ncbi:MAG: ABC transporter permease [Methanomicrobiales archaeon]|nr:ABC transporter permease [Methanomicrobiales archaeon]
MTDRKEAKGRSGAVFFSLAGRNLRRHAVRSALATIGIIIGVIALASLGILGNSITLLFAGLVSDVSDTILITPHLAVSSGDPFDPRNQLPSSISARDVDAIRKAAGTNAVIPMVRTAERIRVGDTSGYAMMYVLDAEDIPLLVDLDTGVYPKSVAAGCVMGTLLADDYEIGAGNRIELGNESVRVVGIAAERGMAIDINPDYAVIVSKGWYEGVYGVKNYSQVIVKMRTLDDLEVVKGAIDSQLNKRDTNYDITDSREILEIFYQTVDAMNILLVGIGAVSLLVASVSILNVMIISVTERTREIGVLRSIGTRRGEVMLIFLFEALILGIAGSIIGGIASAGIGYWIAAAATSSLFSSYGFRGEAPLLETMVIYIVLGLAFGIGTSMLAGLYPAWKAARLDPIEALRYE